MADSFIQIAADSTGKKLDTRTEGTNTEHRQVVVLGDPATNTGVAPVDATNGLSVNVTNSALTVNPGNTANTTAWKMQLYDGTTALPILAGSSGAPAASAPALAVSLRDVNPNGSATSANSAPVVIASDQAAVKVTPGVSATSNGATPSRINAAASTNATSLKASAGQAYGIDVFNVAAYNVFLKLYNKASAPTVGTDTPFMTIPVAAGGGASLRWNMGLPMGTGIAYAITKLQADSDTTAVAAGDLTGLMLWI
jgi:hypothetical protein